MYTLKTSAAFDSAHFLSGYEGKCSNIHGHRWLIEAEIGSDKLIPDGQKRGMVIDFSDLKRTVRAIADNFDHALIIEENSLRPETFDALTGEGFRIISLPMRPTAENFAKHFYELLKEDSFPVLSVRVYETPENCACYREDVMPL